jgi:hypothetical protein
MFKYKWKIKLFLKKTAPFLVLRKKISPHKPKAPKTAGHASNGHYGRKPVAIAGIIGVAERLS